MAIESLDTRQQLAVVTARDQHLRVRAHRRLEDRERAAGEFVLLEGGDLKFAVCLLAGCRVGAWRGGRRGGLGWYAGGLGRGRDVREVVAWLRQQFSGGQLAFQTYNGAVEVRTYWILAVSAMVYV